MRGEETSEGSESSWKRGDRHVGEKASHRGHGDTEFFRAKRRADARGEDTEAHTAERLTEGSPDVDGGSTEDTYGEEESHGKKEMFSWLHRMSFPDPG